MVFAFLGTQEIIIILVVALLVFGPQRLPDIGKQVGTALRELNKVRNDVQKALDLDELTGNNHYDSYNSYGTYDSTAHTTNSSAAMTDTPATAALPHYESPQETTYAASSDAYEAHYGVTEPSNFIAPPGPKAARPEYPAPFADSGDSAVEKTAHEGTV